jgi:hypothetical protein
MTTISGSDVAAWRVLVTFVINKVDDGIKSGDRVGARFIRLKENHIKFSMSFNCNSNSRIIVIHIHANVPNAAHVMQIKLPLPQRPIVQSPLMHHHRPIPQAAPLLSAIQFPHPPS